MTKVTLIVIYLGLCVFCLYIIYQPIVGSLLTLKDISLNKSKINAVVVEKLRYPSECEFNMSLAGTGDLHYLVQIKYPDGIVVDQPICSRYNYEVNNKVPFFYSSNNVNKYISVELYNYAIIFYSFALLLICFSLFFGFILIIHNFGIKKFKIIDILFKKFGK